MMDLEMPDPGEGGLPDPSTCLGSKEFRLYSLHNQNVTDRQSVVVAFMALLVFITILASAWAR